MEVEWRAVGGVQEVGWGAGGGAQEAALARWAQGGPPGSLLASTKGAS